MKSIFKKLLRKCGKGKDITIVSGLPRSGTSLMMQMLEAGGMPIVTDRVREPDDDNPRGYYEHEKVKKIKEDSSWLKHCQGKAFKMVSELLIHLPEYNKYKVIFMRRKMEEMLASQRLMLQRLGREEGKVSDQELAGRFEEHLRRMENWLAKQANIEVLHAKYDDVIQAPLEHAGRVNRFLGGWLNEERMAQVVEVSLYRQRIPSTMHSEVQSQDEQEKIRERLEDLGYI